MTRAVISADQRCPSVCHAETTLHQMGLVWARCPDSQRGQASYDTQDPAPVYTVSMEGDYKPWCLPALVTWREFLQFLCYLVELRGWLFYTLVVLLNHSCFYVPLGR